MRAPLGCPFNLLILFELGFFILVYDLYVAFVEVVITKEAIVYVPILIVVIKYEGVPIVTVVKVLKLKPNKAAEANFTAKRYGDIFSGSPASRRDKPYFVTVKFMKCCRDE